jgi:asparaginyl-tRNA synthetase
LEEAQRNIPQWIASAKNFEYGNDLGGSDETVITRLFDKPIMVYDWPHEVKAFYLKRNPESPRFARGVDVLAPEGYGEIVGGGERETDEQKLREKIIEHDLPMEAFEMVFGFEKIRYCASCWFWFGFRAIGYLALQT